MSSKDISWLICSLYHGVTYRTTYTLHLLSIMLCVYKTNNYSKLVKVEKNVTFTVTCMGSSPSHFVPSSFYKRKALEP